MFLLNLVSQAKILLKRGKRHLSAQDSTYYSVDLYGTRSLSKLLKELVKVDGIEWLTYMPSLMVFS